MEEELQAVTWLSVEQHSCMILVYGVTPLIKKKKKKKRRVSAFR